jgi:hypothetical protein
MLCPQILHPLKKCALRVRGCITTTEHPRSGFNSISAADLRDDCREFGGFGVARLLDGLEFGATELKGSECALQIRNSQTLGLRRLVCRSHRRIPCALCGMSGNPGL